MISNTNAIVKTLGELSIENKGNYGIAASAVDYSKDLYTYLRITDINDDGTLNYSDFKSVDDENAYKYLLKENDIVFARTGNSTGRAYLYDKRDGEFVYAGFLIKFSLNPLLLNPWYMKYFTQSKLYKDWITSFNTGSTRGNINAQTYSKMPVLLPEREFQDKLVYILNLIDDKIKLNNRLNDNLEEQIRLLFNKYYESADNEIVLSECCTLTSSKRVFAKEYVREGVPFYRGKEITLKRNGKSITDILYISEEHYEEIKNKYGVPNIGDILLTAVGTLGNSYMVQEEKFYFKDGNIIWLKDFKSKEANYYIYDYMQSSLFSNAIDSIRIGSTQSALTIVSLGKLKVLLPNESMLKEYYNLSKTIRDRINANIKETEKLSELRDTLLPNLLSGELDLTNVDLEG